MTGIVSLVILLAPGIGFGEAAVETEEKSSAELLRMGDEAFGRGRYSAAVEFYRSVLRRDEGNFTARLKLIELLARLAGREEEARKEMGIALAMEGLAVEEVATIAEICRANGFPDQARTAYERLLKENPGDWATLGRLVEVLVSQKDFDRARRAIETYRDSSGSTIEGLERLAAKCMERSRFELAEVAYEGVLKRDERNLRALVGAAECLVKSGRLPEAVEKLTRAAEWHPEKAEPAVALGKILLRGGDYASAEKAFGEALRIEARSEEAAEGMAEVLFCTGRYAECREILGNSLRAQPNSPLLLAAMGRVLTTIGENESAREHFEKALAARAGYPDAVLGLGLLYRETGKLDLAKREFLKLYDFWDAHVRDGDSVPAQYLLNVAVACALTDNPQDAVDVLEEVLKRDPSNTEALLWEARLFAERHQPGDATRELKKLLGINPNHPEAHAELARIHFDSYQYDRAAESCQRALEINPNLIGALDLLCSIQILDFDYEGAEGSAKKGLAVNPRSLSSLSSLASCYWQMGKKEAYEDVRKKVFEINPLYAEFYLTVAQACENKRRNEEAIALLKEAIALRPDSAAAHTRTGILLMREGEEEEAERYLREAYRLDSYNPRTTNFINLLEHMKKNFVSERTDHFLLRWDREKGSPLGFFLPEYVEEVYGEVCEEFGHEPKNPTLVEIFDSHDQFSARIVGLPFIATVGGSLGKVVATDSPKSATFNWKDVLRHEFVHVVNLQQSRMQIPFWFTEGLATWHEQSPLPEAWDGLIARMLFVGRIVPLKELNSCFTRPKSPSHKHAAYAESNRICRYLYEKHGREVIRKMIGAYGEGFSTEEVIQQCLSMSESEFEGEVRDHIFAEAREKRVAPVFLPEDGKVIAEGLKEKPENSLLRVAQGRWLLQEAQAGPPTGREARLNEAAELLRKVVEDDPVAYGAWSALAEVLVAHGKWEEAKEAAAKGVAIDEKDFAVHRCLAFVYRKEGKEKEAVGELEQAAKLYPRGCDAWYELAALYSKENDEAGEIRSLERAAEADRKNMQTAKRLARQYLSEKEYDRAIAMLEGGLEYNLYDAEVYRLIVEGYGGKGDEKSAERYAKIGAEAAYITATSRMPFEKKKVIELLRLAVELDPEHEKAKSLLKQIGEPEGTEKRGPGHSRRGVGGSQRGNASVISGKNPPEGKPQSFPRGTRLPQPGGGQAGVPACRSTPRDAGRASRPWNVMGRMPMPRHATRGLSPFSLCAFALPPCSPLPSRKSVYARE